jgi:hypothetical protein
MAKLIFKAPYYKAFSRTPTGSSRGGYARYIATREGVEILPRSGMADYIGERKGSNGLFSDAGKPIVLSRIEEELDSLIKFPAFPVSDGTYTLKLVVSGGSATMSWVAQA